MLFQIMEIERSTHQQQCGEGSSKSEGGGFSHLLESLG
jgi:hypothetical protein